MLDVEATHAHARAAQCHPHLADAHTRSSLTAWRQLRIPPEGGRIFCGNTGRQPKGVLGVRPPNGARRLFLARSRFCRKAVRRRVLRNAVLAAAQICPSRIR